MVAIIQMGAFGGPLDGADVSVNVDESGWPLQATWVNWTQLDHVVWPGAMPDPPEQLAGPLWSKYVVASDPDHGDDRQPWRCDFVRSQDEAPDLLLDALGDD
jgi:hypothetical protein